MMDDEQPNTIGPELLGWLLDRHAAALELYARQWCGNPEDVVQETLIQLAAQEELPHDVRAWLYRVVRNKAINASRSDRRRKGHELKELTAKAAWFATPLGDAIDAQTAAEALETLPDAEREVVIAHLWSGLTFQQIGDLMGTTDSTAYRRYVAALTALRKKLRIPCPEND